MLNPPLLRPIAWSSPAFFGRRHCAGARARWCCRSSRIRCRHRPPRSRTPSSRPRFWPSGRSAAVCTQRKALAEVRERVLAAVRPLYQNSQILTHVASAPLGHSLQKRTVVQWDMGAVLGRDGGTDESMSPHFGITWHGVRFELRLQVRRNRIRSPRPCGRRRRPRPFDREVTQLVRVALTGPRKFHDLRGDCLGRGIVGGYTQRGARTRTLGP